jgi:CheY-like chemotaxis protein
MVTAQWTGSAMELQDENSSRNGDRILVLSANGAGQSASITRLRRAAEQLGWPVVQYAVAGAALRQIALTRPSGLLVLVDVAESIEKTTTLIFDLRRYQPQLPLVAVAQRHDEQAERQLRTAGATAYVAGTSSSVIAEAAELISAARSQREPPEQVPRVFAARSPPKLRGRRAPPPRIRGQP